MYIKVNRKVEKATECNGQDRDIIVGYWWEIVGDNHETMLSSEIINDERNVNKAIAKVRLGLPNARRVQDY